MTFEEMSPSQLKRIEAYVRQNPRDTAMGNATVYQAAMHMEESAARVALTMLDARALRRMSLIRALVKGLTSEEWFRMTSVAGNPASVRSELQKARQRG